MRQSLEGKLYGSSDTIDEQCLPLSWCCSMRNHHHRPTIRCQQDVDRIALPRPFHPLLYEGIPIVHVRMQNFSHLTRLGLQPPSPRCIPLVLASVTQQLWIHP